MGAARSVGQLEARYDGELRRLDAALARLFERLKRIGRWNDTTVVVVGTFGVGFGEGGLLADSGTYSDCDLRVPIVVRAAASLAFDPTSGSASSPGSRTGVRIEELASLADLAPTLLDLHGVPIPAGMQGFSHVAALRGAGAESTPILFASGGVQSGFAAIDERYCYEEGSPGGLEQATASSLSISFYGDDLDHRGEPREHLHDRSIDPYPGHLRPSADEPEEAARLAAAGREHYAWIEKARAVLQDGAAGAARERGEMDELRRRGLIGDLGSRP
jgi:hypothetical protein